MALASHDEKAFIEGEGKDIDRIGDRRQAGERGGGAPERSFPLPGSLSHLTSFPAHSRMLGISPSPFVFERRDIEVESMLCVIVYPTLNKETFNQGRRR